MYWGSVVPLKQHERSIYQFKRANKKVNGRAGHPYCRKVLILVLKIDSIKGPSAWGGAVIPAEVISARELLSLVD